MDLLYYLTDFVPPYVAIQDGLLRCRRPHQAPRTPGPDSGTGGYLGVILSRYHCSCSGKTRPSSNLLVQAPHSVKRCLLRKPSSFQELMLFPTTSPVQSSVCPWHSSLVIISSKYFQYITAFTTTTAPLLRNDLLTRTTYISDASGRSGLLPHILRVLSSFACALWKVSIRN